MKRERVMEYARMVLGPVRFADKETRSQTVHTLHAMLNEEAHLCGREERHPRPPDPLKDATRIDESYSLDARELAKAGVLAPWKKKLAKVLGL
jgi:hypothetical protein